LTAADSVVFETVEFDREVADYHLIPPASKMFFVQFLMIVVDF
jgi:hypothetical protein